MICSGRVDGVTPGGSRDMSVDDGNLLYLGLWPREPPCETMWKTLDASRLSLFIFPAVIVVPR